MPFPLALNRFRLPAQLLHPDVASIEGGRLLSPQLLLALLAIALEILCVLSSLELISILQPGLGELPAPVWPARRLGKGRGPRRQPLRGAGLGQPCCCSGGWAGYHPSDSFPLDWGH